MRRVIARFVLVGMLVVSCESEPSFVGPCITVPADTVFDLYDPGVRLVVGAAHAPGVTWQIAGCDAPTWLGTDDVTWTTRDSSIVAVARAGYDRVLVARTPGETFVVAAVSHFADSLRVTVPDTASMGRIVSLAAAGDVSCAVDTQAIAFCWGYGETLLGNPWSSAMIGRCYQSGWCSPMPIPRETDAHVVYVGPGIACVTGVGGRARCWGGTATNLGSGNGVPSFEPVSVAGDLAFTALSLASTHACGVLADGSARCWGDVFGGQLGIGKTSTTTMYAPAAVAGGDHLRAIATSDNSTCGVTTDGALRCWGVLGPPNVAAAIPGAEVCALPAPKGAPTQATCAWSPVRMAVVGEVTDTLFTQVSGPCALTTLGSVFCYDAQQGSYARAVGVGPYTVIARSAVHGCGLTSSGAASCWGMNDSGQLGDGTRNQSSAPVPVAGGHTFVQVAVGYRHSCGLTTGGEVWCWGHNWSGQSGAPFLDETLVPVRVRGQAWP